MDPFHSECRAYGRLIEKDLNGEVAVRCHGYLALPATLEARLAEEYHVHAWDRPQSEYRKRVHRRPPFRAILKDLVTEDIPFTEKLVIKMLRDLKRMRRVGVYPMDIEARNYKGGLLIDFSIAVTIPHYLFEIKTRKRIRRMKRQDLVGWESLVENEGIQTWTRAVRNEKYVKTLRPRDNKGKAVTKV